jgi:hypothetical protein
MTQTHSRLLRGAKVETPSVPAQTAAQANCGAPPECVVGPWRGYFVAAYVTELAGAFYGYAKVYEHQPEDPWCADALMKIGSPGCPCPAEALDKAREGAFVAIDDMLAGAKHILWRQLALRAARRAWAAAANLCSGA